MSRTCTRIKRNVWRSLEPPPDLKISEWSDAHRYLSAEASAEPGKFYMSRTPYMREPVDTVCDPDVKETWFRKSAQVAYSENGNNIMAYFMDQDPCPMMMMQPTLQMSEAYSKDRISPMIRDTPRLTAKVDDRARTSGNTILHKKFPGGHLTMCGANSPSSLASRPIRGAFCDEPDRYPASAGDEGDPIKLLQKRQITFWNAWFFAGGTPTIKGASRIDSGFYTGDQRFYNVPCPHCEELIVLKPEAQDRDPESDTYAQFECTACGDHIHESHKLEMIKDAKEGGLARWVATEEFKGIASFHIWAAYSPWMTWREIADEYNATKDDPELFKTYRNTIEGETYEEAGEAPELEDLMKRREDYEPGGIPDDVLVITAGIDSQGDRLEIEVVGWGQGEESWSLDYRTFPGDPLESKVWHDLDTYLQSATFTRRDGLQLKIKSAGIDSGGKGSQADGHVSDRVYKYVKGKIHRNIFAVKGGSVYGQPIVARISKLKKAGIRLVIIGTDTAKDLIYARLELGGEGPGRCHFPLSYERRYFEMLTAEEKIIEFKAGRPVVKWKLGEAEDAKGNKKKKKRNEALDCRVYALAMLRMLPINLDALAKRGGKKKRVYKTGKPIPGEETPKAEAETEKPAEKKPKAKKKTAFKRRRPARGRGGGWSASAL